MRDHKPYLSYHHHRRKQWKDHEHFPLLAVKYQRDHFTEQQQEDYPLYIYKVSEDRQNIILIQEKYWQYYGVSE